MHDAYVCIFKPPPPKHTHLDVSLSSSSQLLLSTFLCKPKQSNSSFLLSCICKEDQDIRNLCTVIELAAEIYSWRSKLGISIPSILSLFTIITGIFHPLFSSHLQLHCINFPCITRSFGSRDFNSVS